MSADDMYQKLQKLVDVC